MIQIMSGYTLVKCLDLCLFSKLNFTLIKSSSQLITRNDVNSAIVIACRDWADFMIAVHYLPEGFLWSSQLHYYQVGLLGTFSSLLRVPTYLLGKQN
jgi:hypothetical protein